jgi:predicted amidohydrolase
LFDVDLPDGTELRESSHTSSGAEPVVVEVAGFKVGLSICYDLRFPELYRALVSRGAEVLVVPAAFTLLTGKDHWHVLLRARAIEAQSWVIAAAQWGTHPKGRTTYGHSLVIDPWGCVVAECSDRVGLVVADLDRGYLELVRKRLPSLCHRRL